MSTESVKWHYERFLKLVDDPESFNLDILNYGDGRGNTYRLVWGEKYNWHTDVGPRYPAKEFKIWMSGFCEGILGRHKSQ